MSKILGAVCVALLAIPAVSVAAEHTETGCDSVNFGQEVLDNFPKAKQACREVRLKNGEPYARFVAEIVGQSKGNVTVKFKDRDNKDVSEMVLTPPEGAKVKVLGESVKIRDLKRGQQLDFWVEHARWGLYPEEGSPPMKVVSRKDL